MPRHRRELNAALQKSRPARREFLKMSALAALGCLVPAGAAASLDPRVQPARSLSLLNTHTGEALQTTYWRAGHYLPEALTRIEHVLRDHRSGESKAIDTGLLDLLHGVALQIGCNEPYHIISGYRSPHTNANLRQQGRGVAKGSLHMLGQAVDVRLPGCNLDQLHQVALRMKQGGVGYYPRSDFIHLDVGPVRRW